MIHSLKVLDQTNPYSSSLKSSSAIELWWVHHCDELAQLLLMY